ncbi:MAG: hypothetical protein Q4P66_07850 [Actinomycetaceae bacterium]|nr:hypothetical protein [Actinomycetaceae bacterium]
MKLLNKTQIWDVYSMEDALVDTAEAFKAVSNDKTISPLRTRMNLDDSRTVLVMPCFSDEVDAVAVKTIGLYPGNASRGLATAPATTIVLDADTGELQAVLDGDTVTKIRTGASSGVAFRALAVAGAHIGVVVGTGGQAFTQVLAMVASVPSLEELRIVNPDEQQLERFIETLDSWKPWKEFGFEGVVRGYSSSDDAAKDADVIILVTSSTEPVLSAHNLKPGVTISCVGSYQPHMQECGADIIERADKIYCDHVESALEESGDLIIPINDGGITRDDIAGDIGHVLDGTIPGRDNDDQIIVYETVGVGAQDLWAASAIVAAAEKAGIGTDIPALNT